MTVAELIKKLESQDQKKQVVFAYDYGDRGHSLVTADIAIVEEHFLKESPYGPRHERLADEEDGNESSTETFVVIR